MKISKKEIYLLLALVGIGIAVCVWQFGFKKINAQTEALQAETELLQKDIQKYSAVKNNIELYQKGIEDATSAIAGVLNEFPVTIMEEDIIMFGRELEKNDQSTSVSSVTFGSNSNVYVATSHPVEATTVPLSYSLYNNQIYISYKTSYDGFKDMIDYIYEHKNRMALESYSLAYDADNGLLMGSAGINMYSVTGTDKEYKQQNLSGVSLGTDNIFGTLE